MLNASHFQVNLSSLQGLPIFFISLGLLVASIVLSIWVQVYFHGELRRQSAIKARNNKTGYMIATEMLHKNNIFDVKIICATRHLSDCYNPRTKTISLSKDIYAGTSIASQAVACHEVGHAIQHNKNYLGIIARNFVLPFVMVANWIIWISILIMFVLFFLPSLISLHSIQTVVIVLLGAFSLVAIFQILTLPVEFNASKRAKEYLQKENILTADEFVGATKVLKRAALTYVVALIVTIMTITRLILQLLVYSKR